MSFERKPVPDSPLPQYGAFSPPNQPQPMELAHHETPYISSPPPQAQPTELAHHDRPYASSPPPQAQPMELAHHERSYASSPPPGYVIQPYSSQYHAHPQMQQMHQTPPAHSGSQGGFSPQPNYYQQPSYFQVQAPAGGNTMSIASLTSSPAPVQCPACGQRATTATTHVPGNTTHAWALGALCITGCLCFVPYMMSSVKDVEHRCSKCGVHLATWHNSGRTDIKMHG